MISCRRKALCGVVGMLAISTLALGAPSPAVHAAQSGVYLEQEIASSDGSMPMELWIQGSSMRVDMSQGDQPMSMIFKGEDEASTTMVVMHGQRQYMVFDQQRMGMMQQMMGGMAGGQGDVPDVEGQLEAAVPTFTRTGRTEQIGSWSADEMLVESPDIDGELRIWLTEDIDLDYFEVMRGIAENMSSAQPLVGGAAGVFGGLGDVDFPAGYPVRVVTVNDGETTTITLKKFEQRSFDAETFEAPAGYQKIEMPGM